MNLPKSLKVLPFALILAACGGGGSSEPIVAPTVVPTIAPTAAPTPAPEPLPAAATVNKFEHYTAGLYTPTSTNLTMAFYLASGTVYYPQDNTDTLAAAWVSFKKDIAINSGFTRLNNASDLANVKFNFYYEKALAQSGHNVSLDATGNAIVNAPPDAINTSVLAADITKKLATGEFKAYAYTSGGKKQFLMIETGSDYLGVWSTVAPVIK